jgi:FecR protein
MVGGLRRLTLITCLLALLAPATAGAATDETQTPVTLTYEATGTFQADNLLQTDHPEHASDTLHWVVTYKGTLEKFHDVRLLQFQDGTLTGPGTYHFTDPAYHADCSGNVPVPSYYPAPIASYSDSTKMIDVQAFTGADPNGTSGAFAGCMGSINGEPVDDTGAAGSLTGAYEAQLPGAFEAKVTVPAGALDGNGFTLNVSQNDAVTPLPQTCSDIFGEDSPSDCTMSVHWSGTLQLQITCGTITFSEGDAPAVGTSITDGQVVSTGADGRAEITFPDGAIMRIGRGSKVQCTGEGFTPEEKSIGDRLKIILGNVWAATSDALGGDHEFDVSTDRAVTGVRGSAFTASVGRNGLLMHVIEGTGFVRVGGKHEFDFPAGLGVIVSGAHYTLTQTWPPAAAGLVPGGQRPPAITGAHLSGIRNGKAALLRFRLNQAAKVTVAVLRGRRTFARVKLAGHRGLDRVHPLKRGLRRGMYVLRVSASASWRASIVQLSFRV